MFQEDYKFSCDDDVATTTETSIPASVTPDAVHKVHNDDEDSLINHLPQKNQKQTKRKRRSNGPYSKEKPYTCDACAKSFKSSLTLSSHKAAMHEGIRPYVCNHCDKRFALISILEKHMITHTKERAYTCDQCPQSFTQSGSLVYHKQNVHEKIRSHACPECDKRFFLAKDLRAHSLSHSGM